MIITTDIKYRYYRQLLSATRLRTNYKPSEVQEYVRLVREIRKESMSNNITGSYLSKERIDYAILDAQIQQWTNNGLAKEEFEISSFENTYQIIDQDYFGKLRDAIKAKLLIQSYDTSGEKVLQKMKQLKKETPYKDIREYLTVFLEPMSENSLAFDFALKDTLGNIVRLHDLRGKIVLIDFWYTGCGACKAIAGEMRRIVAPTFLNRKDLVFVTISVDKDVEKWKMSVRRGDYVKPGGIDLYTNGEGYDHPVIKHYYISGYPKFIIIDKEGKIISTNPPRPWINDMNGLTTKFINYLQNLLDNKTL